GILPWLAPSGRDGRSRSPWWPLLLCSRGAMQSSMSRPVQEARTLGGWSRRPMSTGLGRPRIRDGPSDAPPRPCVVRAARRGALDATGAVLPGVRVAARHLETGLVREAESGSGGEFVLPAVPVGAYEVTAARRGLPPPAPPGTGGAGGAGALPRPLVP